MIPLCEPGDTMATFAVKIELYFKITTFPFTSER